jgi:hypothetical protein
MGASSSMVDDRHRVSQLLPVELIIEILLNLPLPELISCQQVSRSLNRIITSSKRIQHQIETATAGVVDHPDSTLSLSERREAFARRQIAWETWNPQRIRKASGSYDVFPDLIQCGVYFNCHHPSLPGCVTYYSPSQPNLSLEPTWSVLEPVRTRDVFLILALTSCLEENDLVSVGIRYVAARNG